MEALLVSIDRFLDLNVFLAVLCALLGILVFAGKSDRRLPLRGRGWTPRVYHRSAQTTDVPITSVKPDAADQLRIVLQADFRKRKLLNRSEMKVFEAADRIVTDLGEGWRVMAQVNLGEILASDNKDAFFAINAKRVDMLIVTADGEPLAAIEYQGSGHHQGHAAARDAVKKEALRRAGVGYIEVVEGDTPDSLRLALSRLKTVKAMATVN